MPRVIAYIDGFNLNFGLRESKLNRFYWLKLLSPTASPYSGRPNGVSPPSLGAYLRLAEGRGWASWMGAGGKTLWDLAER